MGPRVRTGCGQDLAPTVSDDRSKKSELETRAPRRAMYQRAADGGLELARQALGKMDDVLRGM